MSYNARIAVYNFQFSYFLLPHTHTHTHSPNLLSLGREKKQYAITWFNCHIRFSISYSSYFLLPYQPKTKFPRQKYNLMPKHLPNINPSKLSHNQEEEEEIQFHSPLEFRRTKNKNRIWISNSGKIGSITWWEFEPKPDA